MLGFYDYTVVLTYVGMLCALFGIAQTLQDNYIVAIFCLAGSLICDTLDGKVARHKQDRTHGEQMFGIQIDSLCDVISFGIFPAVMFYSLGLQTKLDFILLGYYCLCCVIRLAYFNVLAAEADPTVKGDYHGLPVVCLAVMVPMAYMLGLWLKEFAFLWLLRFMLGLFGLLYTLDFDVKKPNAWKLIAMCTVFWVPLAVILMAG